MNLYFRLLVALVAGALGRRRSVREVLVTSHRVWPQDLDAFGHMNNGRYLQVMDVARAQWMVRSGVFGALLRHRWSAVLGGGMVRFRHALNLGQPYFIETELVGWDQRWWYLEHRFRDRAGRPVAAGISRAALRSRGRWVPTEDVVALIEPDIEVPKMPAYVRDWLENEQRFWEGDTQAPREVQAARVESTPCLL